jgi:hypothetical protein
LPTLTQIIAIEASRGGILHLGLRLMVCDMAALVRLSALAGGLHLRQADLFAAGAQRLVYDDALGIVLAMPAWVYLAPLKRRKPIYRALRRPENRLRKPGAEILKDGSTARNPQRMGPLTFAARL